MHRFVLIFAVICGLLHTAAFGQSVLNLSPSRVVGQPSVTFRSASPNVVEGRELYLPLDVAVDTSSSPRAVYVADFGNNRVLGWRDSQNFTNGGLADFVLGQVDRTSTLPLGPGTTRSLGLNSPTSVAVDGSGNVYVADSGNNRILRFPRSQILGGDNPVPDLVLGQPGFTSSAANQGGISEKSLSLASYPRSDMAFDPKGNLWVTDPGNNRVLRYPADALASGVNRPAADVVVGQTDFITGALATDPPDTPTDQTTINATNKSILRVPFALALDNEGRLYVADTFGRVVVFLPEVTIGRVGARVVGIQILARGQPARVDEVLIASVGGLFTVGNRLGVVDPSLNRITMYDPFPDWPAESETAISPSAKVVIGQQNFNRFEANRNQAEPSGNSLAQPYGVFYAGPELWVADSGNNRVIVLPDATASAVATRVLGQTALNLNAPNLTEGKELFLFNGFTANQNLSGEFSDGGGVAIDNSSSTPRLYISDTFNNRVLGYRDARRVRPGDKADIVIGQIDFQRTLVNAPFNTPDSITNAGLYRPSGLAVDANGDLYIADSGNGRVLRFPRPFDQPAPGDGERLRANLVLGQLNFTTKITDASARNMAYPFGLAFTVEGSLVVSDAVHSRLLFFRRPVNGDFTNGQAAERVIGQPDFLTVGRGTGTRRLASPRHIAIDTDDRLYVTDAGNNRVFVYDRITTGSNDPQPAFTLTGVTSPQGIWVSPLTGEIWVANTRGNQATRFPRFERLAIDNKSDYNIPSATPLALTQDASGNLYIAEATNRIAMFYNALTFQIAGSYSNTALAPGTISILYPAGAGVTFAPSNTAFSTVPLPTELADIQVLLNEKPVPMYFAGPLQVNFLVPMTAPDNGTAEIQVVRKSTGQILAVSNPQFARVAPALFVQGGAAQGQLAALNEDNTVNTPSNPAAKGSIIQLFGTGQGFVPNAPPDGQAPTGQTQTQDAPRVYLGGGDFVPASDVLYSGLAPSLVGVWQINARIPQTAAPGQNDAFVLINSAASNRLPNGQVLRTFISVKP